MIKDLKQSIMRKAAPPCWCVCHVGGHSEDRRHRSWSRGSTTPPRHARLGSARLPETPLSCPPRWRPTSGLGVQQNGFCLQRPRLALEPNAALRGQDWPHVFNQLSTYTACEAGHLAKPTMGGKSTVNVGLG